MADAIVRLKVESQEYEGKLKRAVQGMQQLEKHVRDMGASFEVAEKADLEFVRALGQMETKATSNKGKLAELKSAFVELSVQYKNLSDAEKKGQFGVALNQSLGQLKGRIDDLGGQIKEANTDINGMGGILDAVAGKIGIPTELLTKMGLAIGAVGAALKVATDALKQNEILMDEWGRATEGAKGIYEGFLNSLNTGDFSGFLGRIREIVSASEAAYDAMDALGTFNAFNQINKERAKTNFQQSIVNYREGKGTKADVTAARDALISELEAQQEFELNAYKGAINKVAQTRGGVNADRLYEILSKGSYQDFEALKALQPSKRETYTYQEYEYDAFDPTGLGGSYVTKTGTRMVAANEQEELAAMLRQLTDEELQSLQALGAQANRTGTEIEQVRRQAIRYGGAAVTATTEATEAVAPEGSIAAAKKNLAELREKWELATDDNKRAELKIQIDEVTQAIKEMSGEMENGAKTATDMWEEYSASITELETRIGEFSQMAGDINLSDDQRDWARGMAKTYQKQLEKMKDATKEAAEEIKTEMEELPSSFDMFKDGVGSIGTMVSALDSLKTMGEDLAAVFRGEMDAWDSFMTVLSTGVGIMETVISVIEAINVLTEISATLKQKNAIAAASEAAAVATGGATQIATNTSVAATAGTAAAANAAEGSTAAGKAVAGIPIVGPILAAAAITAVLGAMIAAISSAKSSGNFADGGIIPGNNFSGDMLTANVNAGELILNRAQQSSIASQLASSNPMGGMQLEALISGESLRLVLANNASRRGGNRSQYAITKFE